MKLLFRVMLYRVESCVVSCHVVQSMWVIRFEKCVATTSSR